MVPRNIIHRARKRHEADAIPNALSAKNQKPNVYQVRFSYVFLFLFYDLVFIFERPKSKAIVLR